MIISFSDLDALAFGTGVLAACTLYYYARIPLTQWLRANILADRLSKDRILVSVANPDTATSLMRLAAILAESGTDTSVCLLFIQPPNRPILKKPGAPAFLRELAGHYQGSLFPVYVRTRTADDITQGILAELEKQKYVQLVLTGWPGPVDPERLSENPVKMVLQKANTHVGVYLERGLGTNIHRILVPVGGGPHSHLALRLACAIAQSEGALVTAVHFLPETAASDEMENQMIVLQQIVEDEMEGIPPVLKTRVQISTTLQSGLIDEIGAHNYDLIVMGASEDWVLNTRLFGAVDDWIADHVTCSLLLVRGHELRAAAWLRRQVKRIEKSSTRNFS